MPPINFLYSTDYDQSHAKQAAKEGGILLLLDVPSGTVVGLNKQVLIPQSGMRGVHLLHGTDVWSGQAMTLLLVQLRQS